MRRGLREQSALVLVSGDAGIGKSRLVGEAVASWEGHVLSGSCLPLTRTLPLLPLAEMLDDRRRPRAVTEELERLPSEHRDALASLVGQRAGPADPLAQGRLFLAFRTLLRAVADRNTTILLVEDVHWADPDTLDLLTLLGHGGGVPNLVTLATCRSDEVDLSNHARAWLENVRRDAATTEIRLRPLGRDAVHELVRWLTGGSPEPGIVDMVYRRSEGNPFFTEQVLGAYGEEGDAVPARVSALLGERLRRTSPRAQQVLAALAVAGRPLGPSQVAAITDLDEAATAAALHELRGSSFVVSAVAGVGLRHELLREALLDAGAGDSPALHRRLAEQLEASGDDTLAAEAAEHYRASGHPAAELRMAERAADRAWRLASYPEAATWYERVIELGEALPEIEPATAIAELRMRAVKALDLGGQRIKARNLAYRNREDLASDPDPLVRARSVAVAARFSHVDDRETGVREMDRAIAMFAALPPSVHQAEALLFRGTSYEIYGEPEPALDLLRQALSVAEEVGSDQLTAQVHIRLAANHLMRDDVPSARAALERARAVERRSPDVDVRLALACFESDLCLLLGRWAEAGHVARSALADAERHGMGRAWLPHVLTWNAAEAALEQGDIQAVGELVDEMTDNPPRPDEAILMPMRAVADIARGSVDAALVRLRAINLHDVPHGPEGVRGYAWALTTALGWAGLHDECVERGLDYLVSVGVGRDSQFSASVLLPTVRSLASSAVDARARRDSARLDRLHETSERLAHIIDAMPVSPFSELEILSGARGARAQWQAELDRSRCSGLEGWREAAEEWERLGTPHRAAYCWWRYAEAAVDRGEAAVVLRPVLQRALELADGHVLQRQRIADLARRARVPLVSGGTTVTSPIELPVPLTPQEVNVLRLVAAGLSNAQIAAELFISPKTVSVHVSNVLRKLEVGNRTQAGAWAVRVGIAPPAS